MDLSQLSDEELIKLYQQEQQAQKTPEQMTDEELIAAYNQEQALAAQRRDEAEDLKPSVTEAVGPYGGVSAYVPALAELGVEGVSGALGGVFGYGTRLYESATGATEEEARKAGQDVRESMTYEPRLKESQEITDYLGNLVEPVVEAVAPYVEPTADFIERAGEQLVGPDLFGETASQTAGEAFRGLPMAGLDLLGLTGTGKLAAAAVPTRTVRLIDDLGQPTAALDKLLAERNVTFEALTPEARASLPPVIEVPITSPAPTKEIAAQTAKTQIESGAPIARQSVEGGKVVRDQPAIDAIDAGFREGGINAIKGYNSNTLAKMQQMVRAHRATINDDAAVKTVGEPSTIAGQEAVKRWDAIDSRLKIEGKKLDDAVKGENGAKPFVGQSRLNDVFEDLNIKRALDEDGNPAFKANGQPKFDYSSSILSPNPKAQKLVEGALRLITEKGPNPTFADAHLLKKQIDELVSYTSSLDGAAATAEDALKRFRHQLNNDLGEMSPTYKSANRIFAKTFDVKNAFKKAMGKKADFKDPELVGLLLRRLTGNQQSGIYLKRALEMLDNWSAELGGTNATSIEGLARLAFDLDQVVSPTKTTSLLGDVSAAVKGAAGDVAADLATGGGAMSSLRRLVPKTRTITPEQQYQAMLKLLTEQLKLRQSAKPAPKQPGTDIVPLEPRD
jgi:hypothetical protein